MLGLQWAMPDNKLTIRQATEADVPLLLDFIRALADYEKLLHEVVATVTSVRESLFGAESVAEALIVELDGEPAAFAVYFHNFSTFMGRQGLYLEDLFVKPEFRRQGIGKRLLVHLAKIAVDRGCDRFDWLALNWNEPALHFYDELGAQKMDELRLFRMSGAALERLAALE